MDRGVLWRWEFGMERHERIYFRKRPPMVLLEGCNDSKGKEKKGWLGISWELSDCRDGYV